MATTLPWENPSGFTGTRLSTKTNDRLERRALNAEWHSLATARCGALGYFVDRSGEGIPLLLLHGVHAAASAYEMRPLFQALRGSRPVFALDLPGFGSSSRDARDYTPDLYAEAIERFLTDVLEVSPEAPCDVVALSISAEFLARAVSRSPRHYRRLVLISPSGLGVRRSRPTLARVALRATGKLLATPPLGAALYRLLATRPSIEYSLSRSFAGGVDPGFVEHALRTSRAPGARHAPLALVRGKLSSADAFDLYAELRVPTLVIYDEDPHTGFEQLKRLLARNGAVRAERVSPSRGLPHFDCPARTVRIIRSFFAE